MATFSLWFAALLALSLLGLSGESAQAGVRHRAVKPVAYLREAGLTVQWILETHAHADHLSSARYIQQQVGGCIAIGENIRQVQAVFKKLYNLERSFLPDGSQFDHLFKDGETFRIGAVEATALLVTSRRSPSTSGMTAPSSISSPARTSAADTFSRSCRRCGRVATPSLARSVRRVRRNAADSRSPATARPNSMGSSAIDSGSSIAASTFTRHRGVPRSSSSIVSAS